MNKLVTFCVSAIPLWQHSDIVYQDGIPLFNQYYIKTKAVENICI